MPGNKKSACDGGYTLAKPASLLRGRICIKRLNPLCLDNGGDSGSG
jgi:hypothetical protein